MAKPGDMEKLNAALGILDSTDLGLSMVWLWTWSTIKSLNEDEQYKFNLSESDVWDRLVEAVGSGHGFTLEYGAEDHYEDVTNWLLETGIMIDLMFEEEAG